MYDNNSCSIAASRLSSPEIGSSRLTAHLEHSAIIPMGTRMLDQRWIDVEHRRRRCVENPLDCKSIGFANRNDVEMSTMYRRRCVAVLSTSPFQCWIDVVHRRRRFVGNTLDLQTETTSKCRRCIDVAVSTQF